MDESFPLRPQKQTTESAGNSADSAFDIARTSNDLTVLSGEVVPASAFPQVSVPLGDNAPASVTSVQAVSRTTFEVEYASGKDSLIRATQTNWSVATWIQDIAILLVAAILLFAAEASFGLLGSALKVAARILVKVGALLRSISF